MFVVIAFPLLINAAQASILTDFLPVNGLTKFKASLNKRIHKRLDEASKLATMEQEVEDFNAQLVASAENAIAAKSRRRLICLPLDDKFDPPMGMFSHGHVQTGDKVSMPQNFQKAFQESDAEIPHLVEISRVEGVTKERVADVADTYAATPVEKVVGGPLDFRAPSNYIFLPWWMMRALGLHPRDIVDVRVITTVPPGSSVKFRPHSAEKFAKIAKPQAVLETELRHYSSLTRGSCIAFDYNGERYWFDVVELRSAPRGEKVPMMKCQDCDVATDFLPAKDTKKPKK